MIDFELSPEIASAREQLHMLAEHGMRPIAREYDEREHEKPWDFINMMWQLSKNSGIGPGATVTPINRAWVDDPVKAAEVTSHIPQARAGTADEMGGVACFLASDDAAYITGQTIFVDGGLTLYPSFREPWSSE